MIESLEKHLRKIGPNYGIRRDKGLIIRRASRYLARRTNCRLRPKTIALVALSVVLLSTAVVAVQAADNVGNSKKPADIPTLLKVLQNAPQSFGPIIQDVQPVEVTSTNPNIKLAFTEIAQNAPQGFGPVTQDIQPVEVTSINPNVKLALTEIAQNETPGLTPVSQEIKPNQDVQPAKVTGIIPNVELRLAQLFGPILRDVNVNTNSADQTTAPNSKTNGVEIGFAQAEDGQGPYRVAQVQPSQSTGEITGVQTSNPPGMETREPETVTNDIDLALGQRSVYSDLRSLEDRITEGQQPVANITSRFSTQSNDLDIYQEEISQDIFFSEGASLLRPGLQYLSYVPDSGNGVSEYSAGFDGSYRINDSSAVTGDFWLNDIEPKGFASDFTPTYDVYLTLWPNDFLRMDFDNKRETFDNVTSLQLGITAESLGGSVDYTPFDFLRLTLRSNGSFYSDSNNRADEEAEAVWRVIDLPIIEVGLRGSGFQFSEQLNNGYFNPNSYYSGEAMFRLQTDLSDDLSVELVASGGLENANPGGNKPLIKSSLQVAYKLPDNWTLDGGVDYFSSQEANSSGFARTSITLGLHKRFD